MCACVWSSAIALHVGFRQFRACLVFSNVLVLFFVIIRTQKKLNIESLHFDSVFDIFLGEEWAS